MWNAFTSDLLDFVNTIKDDTSTSIAQVIGDNDGAERPPVDELERMKIDLRRSVFTFADSIETQHTKEFERFRKKFSLASVGSQIGELLDLEPDVTRFYADLVPSSIGPEDFWSRYFFRLQLLEDSALSIGQQFDDDDDEEEQLQWDDDGTPPGGDQCSKSTSLKSDASSGDINDTVCTSDREKELERIVAHMEVENKTLKSKIKTLVKRIEELDNQVKTKDLEITSLLKVSTAGDTLTLHQHGIAKSVSSSCVSIEGESAISGSLSVHDGSSNTLSESSYEIVDDCDNLSETSSLYHGTPTNSSSSCNKESLMAHSTNDNNNNDVSNNSAGHIYNNSSESTTPSSASASISATDNINNINNDNTNTNADIVSNDLKKRQQPNLNAETHESDEDNVGWS